MINNYTLNKSIKFRRFSFFDRLSFAFNAILAIVFLIISCSLHRSDQYQIVLTAYLIVSVVFWIDARLRLSRLIKDVYLTNDRHRSGYKDDIASNAKEFLLSIITPILLAPVFNLYEILIWFIGMNLGLIAAEMTIFVKQKPKISRSIDEKIADLRAEIISIFYKRSLEKMIDTEKIDRIEMYLNLGELDYFLNHTDLIEEMYEELRSKIDQLKNETRQFAFDVFLFKLSCLASLHAIENDQSDFMLELKHKTINAAVTNNLYDLMRYLD